MIETVILNNLVSNEKYARKVLPFLQFDYFQDDSHKTVFDLTKSYINHYNCMPPKSAIALLIEEQNLRQDLVDPVNSLLEIIYRPPDTNTEKIEWLLDETEKFCKDRALYNAINDSILAYNDQHKTISKTGIPQLLQDALSVTFDASIGHDYIEDSAERFLSYQTKLSFIPSGITILDQIMDGGFPDKSLIVPMAGTGAGKSLFMSSCAAWQLLNQYNVLYITLELSDQKVAQRIDANLLGIDIKDVQNMPPKLYQQKMDHIKETAKGKLIIKEYPPATVGANTFRALLQELRIKKNFQPDIIYIDYLNNCVSERFKSSSTGPYMYFKSVAEELRAIGVEYGVPIVAPTQLNRSGYTNSDADLEDTSESFGVPQTADIMFVMITSEELRDMNQVMTKQLKNRFGDINNPKRFVMGVDYAQMRMYDVDETQIYKQPTKDTHNDSPPKSKSKFT